MFFILSIRSRPPDLVQGGASLTDSADVVGPVRVRESRFVYSDDSGLSSRNMGNNDLQQMIYKYKDYSMKEAAAAHHGESIKASLQRGTAPRGLLGPILKTLINSMQVPFKYDPAFSQELKPITEAFCHNVWNCVIEFWNKRRDNMRESARALKKEIYETNSKEGQYSTQTIEKMDLTEKQIARKRRELANTRSKKSRRRNKRKNVDHNTTPLAKRFKSAAEKEKTLTPHPKTEINSNIHETLEKKGSTKPKSTKPYTAQNQKLQTIENRDQCENGNKKQLDNASYKLDHKLNSATMSSAHDSRGEANG